MKTGGATSRERIQVLLVNADNMTSELLVKALQNGRNRFNMAALTGSSMEIIGRLGKSRPEVALVSANLEDGPQAGFAVLQKLREASPETAVIMLLDSRRPGPVVEAFRQGARGVFYRIHHVNELFKCITAVHEGQVWARNEDLQFVLDALGRMKPAWVSGNAGMNLLTQREEEVAHLVADGLRNREVAEALGVTEHSVRNYIYRIFDKLGISNRVELVLFAVARTNETGAGLGLAPHPSAPKDASRTSTHSQK